MQMLTKWELKRHLHGRGKASFLSNCSSHAKRPGRDEGENLIIRSAKRLRWLPLSGVSQQFAEGRRAFVPPRHQSNKYGSDSKHNVKELKGFGFREQAAARPADRLFRPLSA